MNKFIVIGIFTVVFQMQGFASPYDMININQYNVSSVVSNSYIRGVIAQGDVTRWNPETFPLKVYIQTENVPADYITQIKRAYSKWQNVTGGAISFTLVKTPDNADMKCYFRNNLPNLSEDTLGYHQFKYRNNYIADSIINFRYADKNGNKFQPELIYTVALHEIGHSLGLAGHSSNPNDLMYPVTKARNYDLSKRDLVTLKLLYSIKPDITNKSFTAQQEKNLMTKTQVIGGEAQLKQDAQTAAKINTKITPNDPSSKLRLAKAYQNNKNYTEAVKEYKSIVPLIDSPDIKSEIYCEITECYINLKNIQAAKNCASYTYKKYPSNKTAVLMPRVQYSGGEKQAAVKTLISLYQNNQNPYAGNLLKTIYDKEKNNPNLRKMILDAIK